MPTYPLTALVVRKTKLGETDSILTLLSRDGSQVRAVAKGLRKPGGRFGARLELYSEVELLLHTGRTLDVITEAQLVRSHASLRGDLDRNAAAAVVADLAEKVSVEGQPEERLYGLATTTLDVMEDASDEALERLVVAFLVKVMAMHGYRPQVDACVICGGELGTSGNFSVSAGGAICSSCATQDACATAFAPQGRAWLDVLLRSRMSEVARLEMPDDAVRDCFEVMRAFIGFHLPARLKALDFYEGVIGSP